MAQSAPWLWLPLTSKEEAEAKIREVEKATDCLHGAILRDARTFSENAEWAGRWSLYYGEVQRWTQESREELDDYGTNAQDAPRIVSEANARLRELREWDTETRSKGYRVPCEKPPDEVSILGTSVSRTGLYVAGAVGVGILALALSREGRAWLGIR